MASKSQKGIEPIDDELPMETQGEPIDPLWEPGPDGPEPETESEPGPPDAEATGISVYIGPSIFGLITAGTVYPKDRKAALADLSEAVGRYPLIASLVVDAEDLPASRIKVKTPGNLLCANYGKLAGEVNKGGITNA